MIFYNIDKAVCSSGIVSILELILEKINNVKKETINLRGENYSSTTQKNDSCAVNVNCGCGL